ncbi:MAG TPA: hypothetical protein PLO09_11435, partial [Pseudomonadales bacterium]|nr:hypothetical protein [Pseudomonadales bacterium]
DSANVQTGMTSGGMHPALYCCKEKTEGSGSRHCGGPHGSFGQNSWFADIRQAWIAAERKKKRRTYQ